MIFQNDGKCCLLDEFQLLIAFLMSTSWKGFVFVELGIVSINLHLCLIAFHIIIQIVSAVCTVFLEKIRSVKCILPKGR